MFSSETPEKFSVQNEGRIELNAGANTLTISRGWMHYDIDFIEISPSAPIPPLAKVTTPPVDPQATPEARALLKRLDDTYGHGAFMGVYSDEDAKYVLDNTGNLPAIMGGDLSSYSPSLFAHRHPEEGRPQPDDGTYDRARGVMLQGEHVLALGLADESTQSQDTRAEWQTRDRRNVLSRLLPLDDPKRIYADDFALKQTAPANTPVGELTTGVN